MIPAPYLPAAAALVRSTHEQRVAITLTTATETFTTRLLAGDLTMEEGWSPRGQLSGSIANIFTVDQLAAIDPRQHTIGVTVDAGYIHPDGTPDVHRIFTGHLRYRQALRRSGTVQFQAWSEEGLAHDARWMETDQFKSFTGITEALEWFASYATGRTIAMDSSIGPGYRADLTASVPTPAGKPIWEIMEELCLAVSVHCFVDVDGAWKVRGKVNTASTDVTVLGNVKDSEDSITRDQDYYSAAVLKYTWRDAMDVDHEITGRYGTLPGKVYYAELDSPTTQAAADLAAESIARSMATRGDSYVGTSPAAYWVRPSSTVRVTLANGDTVDQIIKAVTFQLAAGTMRTTTRQPSNLGES